MIEKPIKLDSHTLIPIGVLIGLASTIFVLGMMAQRFETTERNVSDLKISVKEISTAVADLRVLLVRRTFDVPKDG